MMRKDNKLNPRNGVRGADNLEHEAEKKASRREKKKRPKMKVSGAAVKKLQDIIRKKG